MPKYKVEHYESKIRRHFDPLIEEQELLIKQYKTEATDRIVVKLSKKMGADKILNALEKAEMQLERAQHQAKTFFIKKAKKDKSKIIYLSTYMYGLKPKIPIDESHEIQIEFFISV